MYLGRGDEQMSPIYLEIGHMRRTDDLYSVQWQQQFVIVHNIQEARYNTYFLRKIRPFAFF